MRVLDLFSGIGGFSLGLEHAGMQNAAVDRCAALANSDEPRLQGWISEFLRECPGERIAWQSGPSISDAIGEGQLQSERCEREEWRRPSDGSWWLVEPDVGRVAHGIPARVDRLRALGNAVVPQIPEILGRAIMKFEASK